MGGSCCSKPKSGIIRAGTFDAGIVGLEKIVQEATGPGNSDERSLARWLVTATRQRGGGS